MIVGGKKKSGSTECRTGTLARGASEKGSDQKRFGTKYSLGMELKLGPRPSKRGTRG